MDKERLRRISAGKVSTKLMLLADEARKTGRWSKGAEVLEQAAVDLLVNAARPEERQARIELRKLDWLLKPKV